MKKIAAIAAAAALVLAVAPAASASTSWPPHKVRHHHAHVAARDTQWG